MNRKVISLEMVKENLENPVDGRNSFEQEYELLPDSEGDPIIIKENIRYK